MRGNAPVQVCTNSYVDQSRRKVHSSGHPRPIIVPGCVKTRRRASSALAPLLSHCIAFKSIAPFTIHSNHLQLGRCIDKESVHPVIVTRASFLLWLVGLKESYFFRFQRQHAKTLVQKRDISCIIRKDILDHPRQDSSHTVSFYCILF
jgi:hypothetical protein